MSETKQPLKEEVQTSASENLLKEIEPEIAEVLKDLPEKKQNLIISTLQSVERESFSGPIPHPRLLQEYENVKNGFAERIVSMAEKEQKHRHKCEDKMVKSTSNSAARGQWFAFIIAILFLGASVFLGLNGQPWLAGVLGGGTLATLVTVFLSQKKPEKKSELPESPEAPQE